MTKNKYTLWATMFVLFLVVAFVIYTYVAWFESTIFNNKSIKMRTIVLVALLIILSSAFELQKAKVIEKVGDFLRKKTKFGDVFLHK